MGVNKKIYLIQQNTEAAIAAIDSYLDYIYSLQSIFLDDEQNLKPELEHDKQAEELLKSSGANAETYEIIRRKLIDEDFNLSLVELDYIALAFFFASSRMKIQINKLTTARAELKDVIEILLEGSDPEVKKVIDQSN